MRRNLLLLTCILLAAFVVRLYRFDSPIADWHSWRQADTSAVSRNFALEGIDLLHPRFDDLSNVPSGLDNPEGYRFVEFPLYNATTALFYSLFGTFSIEQWGRLLSIFAQLLSITFLYLLVRKYANTTAAVFTAFFFAFLPYNIYYGRSILPDPAMVSAILGGIYFFDKWVSSYVILRTKSEESRDPSLSLRMTMYFLFSVAFTAAAFLFKPYALFFALPMIYLAWKAFGFKLVVKWQLFVFAALTLAPLIAWRIWMQQFPEGIPVSNWLFNEGNIRFKGAYFNWLFAERIAKLILGYWGVPLLVLGLVSTWKKSGFFYAFLASSLAYLVVMARGNVQHDYYQILIMPTIAIFAGLGASTLLSLPQESVGRRARYVVLGVCVIFSLMFGWYQVRDYFNINNRSIIIAGEAVDSLLPKDAKIIALYGGDTSFLYQTKRKGWTSFQRPLPEMVKMGASYMVIANPTKEDGGFEKEYSVVAKTPEYVIFDLQSSL